jgi:hypothetical protein
MKVMIEKIQRRIYTDEQKNRKGEARHMAKVQSVIKWSLTTKEEQRTDRIKVPCIRTTEPTKEGPLSFVLFESPFTSVSTVSRGHPSLVSLA